MQHPVKGIDGLEERGGAYGLDAPTLVHGHVHDDGTGLHAFDEGLADEPRGSRPCHEHAAHEQIGASRGLLDIEGVGGDCDHASGEDIVGVAQPIQVDVEQ